MVWVCPLAFLVFFYCLLFSAGSVFLIVLAVMFFGLRSPFNPSYSNKFVFSSVSPCEFSVAGVPDSFIVCPSLDRLRSDVLQNKVSLNDWIIIFEKKLFTKFQYELIPAGAFLVCDTDKRISFNCDIAKLFSDGYICCTFPKCSSASEIRFQIVSILNSFNNKSN